MVDKKNPKLGGRFNVDDAIRIMDDIPESKVIKAYKLARDRKPSGRLNVDDIERALGAINDTTRKAKKAMTSDEAYSGSKFLARRRKLDKRPAYSVGKAMQSAANNQAKNAYKLARDRKPSGRLNLDDIERATSSKKPDITKRAMGGSMGGGMNPMGRSPDPTVQSVTGYNPNRPNMRKKGGEIKRRGGGIAKRGMGKAK